MTESTSCSKCNNNFQKNYDQSADCCYPKSVLYKCIILLLICAAGSGSYYCDAAPSALQDKFRDNLNITTTQFSLFFSINAWPSVFLCFISGILIDKIFGIRMGSIVFILLQTFGQLLFSFGATINEYWVMMFGKFLFGAGDEALGIALANYPVIWFKKEEMNMVFGLQIAISRLSSTANYWTMEPLYNIVENSFKEEHAVGISLFFISIACILSTICAVVLSFLDKRAEKILSRKSRVDKDAVLISDAKSFELNFWILCIMRLNFYIAFFSFISLAKVFLEEKFHLSPDEANRVNSLVYTIPALACPLSGLIVDKTGKHLLWIFIGLLSILASILLFAFTDVTPQVGVCLMGLGYSICSVLMWSMAPMMIPEKHLGTAYGILNSVKNLGLALFSMVSGMIVDHSGYFTLQMYSMGFIITSIICAVILWIRTGSYLNMTSKNREAYGIVSTVSDKN